MKSSEKPCGDPLIDEVRQRRKDLFASCGHDLSRLLEAIQRVQDEHPEKVIDRRKRDVGSC